MPGGFTAHGNGLEPVKCFLKMTLLEAIYWGTAVAGGVIGCYLLLSLQPLGRNRSWNDFEHCVRSSLILQETGSRMHVTQRGAEVQFDFVRGHGDERRGVLLLHIPRAAWSERHTEALREACQRNSLECSFFGPETDKPLLEVQISVPDIWAPSCGAQGARVAHLTLEALQVPRTARFDFSFVGPHSRRYRRNLDKLSN